jgi:hypothetical protein
MATQKSGFKLLIYAVLLLLLLFGLIRIFVNTSGSFFLLELFGTLFLLLLTLIGFAGYKSWGERVLFFVFLFYLINLVLIWYHTNALYLVLLFIAVAGFLLSSPHRNNNCDDCSNPVSEEPHSEVFEPVRYEEPKEVKTAAKTSAKTQYSPGKFLASKRGNVYHLPKCDWAKRISKTGQVWFKSKEEAWEKGYKAHSCIEE